MDLDDVKALIGALRTAPAPASTTHADGTVTQAPTNSRLGPIEQRRDGYRLYTQEARANGTEPQSYEEWISKEE